MCFSPVRILVLFSESRVVRAVALPQRVGSLALISACGGPATPPYFHPALLYFHGIVAVGMMEGRTLLLDLNMDESVESSDSNPAGVFFIGTQSRDIARLRRKAIDEGQGSYALNVTGPILKFYESEGGGAPVELLLKTCLS